MDLLQKDVEYYEELFPITKDEKNFFDNLLSKYALPAKFLRIGCGTGVLENLIVKKGHDVTGLEVSKGLIESANLKRRTPECAIRFFSMSTLEMTRFLAKKFYNIIACLNSRLMFIHDKTLMRKFFYDCRSLLTENGVLVLNLANFSSIPENEEYTFNFPDLQSVRINYYSHIFSDVKGNSLFSSELEHHSGKFIPVMEDEKVFPIKKAEIELFAKEAGFTNIDFYGGFDYSPFQDDSPWLVCCLS